MKKFIEITSSQDLHQYEDDSIFYAHGRVSIDNVFNYLNESTNLTLEQMLMKVLNSKVLSNEEYKDLKKEHKDYCNCRLSKEIIAKHLADELIEYMTHHTEVAPEKLIKAISSEYVIDTAGYSPWSEFISHKDSTKYAKDLWDGYNFYNIALLDDKGNVLDNIWQTYLPEFTVDEIMKVARDYFGEDLEPNICGEIEYLTGDFKEFNKVPTTTYEMVPVQY